MTAFVRSRRVFVILLTAAAWWFGLACPAWGQFGPTQTIFRNAVKSWAGTLDVRGAASGTVPGPVVPTPYTTSQHLAGNLTVDQYNPSIGGWAGTLDGTITISESAIVSLGCTITNTYTASTSAQSDFRGVPLTFNITFDIGSDTWSIWPSNNSVNGTATSVQECAGVSQTTTATNPLRFMPLSFSLGFPFPATGFDLVGTSTYTCPSCGNAASNPVTYTYTYNLKATTNAQATVATNPPGLAIMVDGAAQTAPQTFNWTPGSTHTIGVTSPQGGAARYSYVNWSDSGTQIHTVTAPSTSTTYTANFLASYLLTATVSPPAGGSITADPPSGDGYYGPNTPVQLTLSPNCGYQFVNWSGDLTGSTNPQTVIMTAPRTVVANLTGNGAICTAQKATMTGPPPGSQLGGSSAAFSWSASSAAAAYALDVGAVQGGTNIFSGILGLATSQTVSGLPTNGSIIWARVWTLLGGVWQFSDSSYTAAGSNTLAVMLTPAPGSVLSGSNVTFTWSSSTGALAYWLDVGTVQGQGDIFAQNVGLATSQAVAGIPTDGSTIYVRLWTLLGGVWQFNDYTYTALGGNSKAVMQIPASGSVLSGASVTFTWSAGTGASTYWLDVATVQGLGDIFAQNVALATSQTVSGIPTDGSTIYVRLWTLLGGVWQFNDYTYTAGGGNTKAVMITPMPGSGLSGASVTFTWSPGIGAATYWLDVGTARGGFDIFSQGAALATSQSVTGIPTDGSTIYVRLWTAASGTWQYNDYTYKAAGGLSKAEMVTPVNGSTLSGSGITFTWSAGIGAAAYWLDVGTAPGGFDLFSQGTGLATSQSVSGIPTNGSTIYVRLWTVVGGVWQFNDYTYKGAP